MMKKIIITSLTAIAIIGSAGFADAAPKHNNGPQNNKHGAVVQTVRPVSRPAVAPRKTVVVHNVQTNRHYNQKHNHNHGCNKGCNHYHASNNGLATAVGVGLLAGGILVALAK